MYIIVCKCKVINNLWINKKVFNVSKLIKLIKYIHCTIYCYGFFLKFCRFRLDSGFLEFDLICIVLLFYKSDK